MKTMFLIADFCADYPGNFIVSLAALEKKISSHIKIVYFFRNGDTLAFKNWLEEFSADRECHLIGFDKAARKEILEFIEKEKPSYLYFHFNGLAFPIGIYQSLNYRQKKEIKILYHVHSRPKPAKSIKEKIKRFGSRALCPTSLIFIACSDEIEGILKKTYPHNKVFISPNKIDFSRLKFHPGKKADPKKGMNVLTFCYDYEIKGGDIAAGIAKKLHEKYQNFRLLMVVARNESEIRKHLSKDFPDHQDYIDILPPSSDVSSLYDLSTIYLLPSRSEGFSYARVEASYSGLCAICSDLPALRDPHLPRLELFPTGDIDAGAALIEKHIFNDPPPCEKIRLRKIQFEFMG